MSRKRLLIIGGVAAGATAAARARRLDENVEIVIVEKGSYLSFANCGLPYFLSGDIQKKSALSLQTPEGLEARYGIESHIGTEALSIDLAARTVALRGPEGESFLQYDSLILAMGSSPFIPPIAGRESAGVFTLWNIPDMLAIDTYIRTTGPKKALVVGGGAIGLEAAEAFMRRGLATTVVELAPHILPQTDASFGALAKESLEASGIAVLTGRSLVQIDSEAKKVFLDDGTELPADLVLLSAGAAPNIAVARAAGLAIGPSGGLLVDDRLRTSDPHVWAAGDMVEIEHRVLGRRLRVPLAGPANRQGRVAATNALGGDMVYAGALGSSIVKLPDTVFAMTGLSLRQARAAGIDARAAIAHKLDHAGYYPGSTELSLELVYERGSLRLLGAQAFGAKGVDKRIDAVAVALAAGMDARALATVDFAYAPPFSSANDPLNIAAFIAMNDADGYSPFVPAEEAIASIAEGRSIALDARTRGESAKRPLKAGIKIPLDELRDGFDALDKEASYLVVSKSGYEGHLAARILRQAGFSRAAYVVGGMRSMELEAGFDSIADES